MLLKISRSPRRIRTAFILLRGGLQINNGSKRIALNKREIVKRAFLSVFWFPRNIAMAATLRAIKKQERLENFDLRI